VVNLLLVVKLGALPLAKLFVAFSNAKVGQPFKNFP
jgi:hypothetical protein